MADEDWSRRSDELEALSSIFGSHFNIIDENHFSIVINDEQETTGQSITLQVFLPSEYPSTAPPTYQLSAPWLRGEDRQRLCNDLEGIYIHEATSVYHALSQSKEDSAFTRDEKDDDNDNDDYDDDGGFDPSQHVYAYQSSMLDSSSTSDCNQKAVELPVIHHGESVKDRKSVFQGHLAHITSKAQVQLVMDTLRENKKIAEATHNIFAYRIDVGKGVFITGCVDDGETHAGARMLHLLNIVNACNVLVVVSRWYGGIHLGPDRFKHINSCTRQLLEEYGYIKDKTKGKQGPQSQTTVSAGASQHSSRSHNKQSKK